MLVSGREILKDALKNEYAVPAFNFANMENLQAIIEGAEELNSPVIIQTTQGAINYAGYEYLADLGKGAAQRSKVPVALHLDHGTDFEYHLKAIRLGWTSLMIDGSKYDFKTNVNMVKQIIKIARPLNISVEAELGVIGGKEDDNEIEYQIYTEDQEAVRFYNETKCDSLAIAVGTVHGVYNGEIKIDFDRIKNIKKEINIPLVLHGSSGIPDNMLIKAVESGINKVNFDTEVKIANFKAMNEFVKNNPGVYDIREIFKPCREAMKKVVMEKIKACKSMDRA